jgi:hypothetical protein
MSNHALQVSFYNSDGQSKSSFFTFSGVDDELKTFIHDISLATLKVVEYVTSQACIHGWFRYSIIW